MSNTKHLIEGQDYTVKYVKFPNCGTDGAIVSHPDLPCIVINTRVCPKRQREALKHELEHLANDDLYSEESAEDIEGRMEL